MHIFVGDHMQKTVVPIMVATSIGCWGRNIPYEGGSSDTGDGEVETVDCNADMDLSMGFRIEGTATDLFTNEPVSGLCVRAIDPSPALTGGDPTDLAASKLCPDGTFTIPGVQEKPSIGLFVVVYNCDESADTGEPAALVMQSATGIATEDYMDEPEGGVVSGVNAHTLTAQNAQTIQSDMTDYTGVLADDGFLGGFIVDADDQPVDGATVSCDGCEPHGIFYMDDDGSDGLFSNQGTLNTSTNATAGSLAIIPAAPVFTYVCEDGGTHTWEDSLFGSLTEYAVFVNFTAL